MRIAVKRVYESANEEDGLRVLVDRLWPRGLSKQHARIDRWLRGLAPSTKLRRWFNHDRTKWAEFKRRYFLELEGQLSLIEAIRAEAVGGTVTLLFSAKDEAFNNAIAMREYLTESK